MSSREQLDSGMPPEEETANDPEHEGWLTAAEACAEYDIAQPTLSRWAATEGSVTREKVGRTFLYEPTSLAERAAKFRPDAANKTAAPENITANTIAASTGQIRALGQLSIEAFNRLLDMSRAQEQAFATLNDHAFKLVESLGARCQRLEETHSELIRAREEYLDGQVERELKVANASASTNRKNQLMQWALANTENIMGLVQLVMNSGNDEANETEPQQEEKCSGPETQE